MSDRGSEDVKSTIQGLLDKFLDDESPLRPVTKAPPLMTDAGPVAPYDLGAVLDHERPLPHPAEDQAQ